MQWNDILSLITAGLGSIATGGVIIFGLSSWLGKVWANRILEEDRKNYTAELDQLRARSKYVNDALATTNTTYLESRKNYAQKRAEAISYVWAKSNSAKKQAPSILGFLGVLKASAFSGTKFAGYEEATSLDTLHKLVMEHSIDDQLLYLDAKTGNIYNNYIKILVRGSYFIHSWIRGEGEEKEKWWLDQDVIRDAIKSIFEDESEKVFEQVRNFGQLQNLIFDLLLNHLKRLATGSDLAKETLLDSHNFIDIVDEIEKEKMK